MSRTLRIERSDSTSASFLLLVLLFTSGCTIHDRWVVADRLGLISTPYRVVVTAEDRPQDGEDTGEESPGIGRGPQPDAGDIAVLKEHGFRTVLNLRGASQGKDWYEEEEEACQAQGLELINLRISSRKGPDSETVERLVEILQDPEKRPLFIHCAGGVHRTGFAVGVYRMAFEGWKPDQAIEEMYDNGFGHQGARRQALLDTIKRLDFPQTLPTPRSRTGCR